ncbi:hypothetical protein [Acetobacterium wieringae]|uniref:hypothetical protein n=1 Tax=Acetobacterium wieringae TaxID=52694 RepID=UPI0026E936B6|nr:hypothetical protein [Acetobacterium wieringae]
MRVVRTLEYIYNKDLNNYLASKFAYASSKGMEVEIELTEPIIDLLIDFKDYKKILDKAFKYAFRTVKKCDEKKLVFCMFYNYGHLYLAIIYPAFTKTDRIVFAKDIESKMYRVIKKYENVHQHIVNEKSKITHQIAIACNDQNIVFY